MSVNHARIARETGVVVPKLSKIERRRRWNEAYERNIRTRRTLKRGVMNRSLLHEQNVRSVVGDGTGGRRVQEYERYLHATKGWKVRRVS